MAPMSSAYSLKFLYNVDYLRCTQCTFTVKARQIAKFYLADSALTLFLKLIHPATHYAEDLDEMTLRVNTRCTLHGDFVSEPALSDYCRLTPYLCLRVKDPERLRLIVSFLGEHKLQRRTLKHKLRSEGARSEEVSKVLKDRDKAFAGEVEKLPFAVQYLVFCVLSAGILSPCDFPFEVFDFIRECKDETEAAKTLELFYTQNTKGVNAAKALTQLREAREFVRRHPSCVKLGERDNFFYVRRVLVTPSMIICQIPTLQESCRALRKHVRADDTLRVAFRDHNLKEIHCLSGYIEHIRCLLTSGLKIGTRRFVFLGYSQSQIRERSCWLVSASLSPCAILESTGKYDLSQLPSVVAARFGHSFATTTPAIELKRDEIAIEPDTVYNSYTFTDGCGRMSQELCTICAKAVRESAIAFQVRVGGCKGVLVLDPRLKGRQIVVRRSMKKFECEDRTLEVVRPAKYMCGYLNREVIVLLGTLGVPDDVFVQMQRAIVEEYMKEIRGETELGPHLKNLEWPEYLFPLRDYVQTVPHAAQHCPFLRSLALVDMIKHLKDIKKKNKIYIAKSCRLVGVIDDTDTLESDEVFVQLDLPHERKVLDEPVFVTRNPCLHPGDIRVLMANGRAEKTLGHLKNVIVFSRRMCPRPVFNMMSNGDLDGDIYFVCWDQRIFPRAVHEPRKSAEKKRHGVADTLSAFTVNTMQTVRDDIIGFFCTFLHSDCIGRVSTFHMVQADLSENRANSPAALRLAELHSVAVDYAKHGIKVDSYELSPFAAQKWPDFLHRTSFSERREYLSTKALGRMYRDIMAQYEEVMHVYSGIEASAAGDSTLDFDLIVPGFEEFLDSAMAECISVEQNLLWVMRMYGVRLEAEAVSGSVIRLDKQNNTKSRMQEIRSELTRLMFRLVKQYVVQADSARYQKASARYLVTFYSEDKEKLGNAVVESEKWEQWRKGWKEYRDERELARLEERIQRVDLQGEKETAPKSQTRVRRMWSYPWLISGKELLEIKLAKSKC